MTYFKSVLHEIDTIDKAYIIGYIYNNLTEIVYDLESPDQILFYCNQSVCSEVIKTFVNKYTFEHSARNIYTIIQKELIQDILRIFNIKNRNDPPMPNLDTFLSTVSFKYSYLRAFFEKHLNYSGSKLSFETTNMIMLITDNEEKGDIFVKTMDIPYTKSMKNNKVHIFYEGTNYIDLYGKLYFDEECDRTGEIFDMFQIENPKLGFVKINSKAIIPSKAHFSDVGIDLTIIDIHKQINSKTILCKTGIQLEIPNGYYIEIVPRSSIIKSGYMLSNSIGIIDASYKGELFVALTKIDEESHDIEFPFRCCQMIMKKQIYPQLKELCELTTTSRGEGGFGSSNKNN
jgi:deoxyuridine 5'-triphosphate nucleotidohydrolase